MFITFNFIFMISVEGSLDFFPQFKFWVAENISEDP